MNILYLVQILITSGITLAEFAVTSLHSAKLALLSRKNGKFYGLKWT